MNIKRNLLCIMIFAAILVSVLSFPVCANSITLTNSSYTENGTEHFLGTENCEIHHNADSIKLYFSANVSGGAKLYYYAFGKEVLLPSECTVLGSVVVIAPTVRLEEGARHKIVFSGENNITEYIFIATKSKNELLLFYDDFESDASKVSLHQGVEGSIYKKELSGNNVLNFSLLGDGKYSSYADAISDKAEKEDKIIIDTFINVSKLTGNAYISLFDTKSSSGEWKQGASIYSDGSLKMGNFAGAEEYICNVNFSVPFRYTAVYDILSGDTKIYIDNEFKKNVTSKNIYGRVYRVDIDARNGGEAEFYIDNLKIYCGDAIIEDNNFGENERTSVMDLASDAKKAIGTAWVFTDAQYYYKDGEKHKYINNSYKPQIIDGKMYVSEMFVSDILLKNSSVLPKTNINGELLIGAENLKEVTGREYMFDDRGFFILSEDEFKYKNSHNFTTLFEESDYIYRYIYFTNPKGEEILQDLKNNIGEKVHPRLCYTAKDIEYIKEKAENDLEWANIVRKTIAKGDNYLNYEITLTSDCPDSEKQNQASSFQSIMESLAEAYLLTENTAYADKGMEYMDIICDWESMGYTTSNLTTGHWAMGMAIGYDSFYNYMMSSDTGKEKAKYYRMRVKELPVRDALDAYMGRQGREKSGSVYTNVRYIKNCDNFQGVISGGMISLVISMADEEDMYEENMYLLENLIRSMELAVSLFAPDGGYYEGVNYSEYMLGNFTKGITALFNTCGTDYGFGNGKGFSDAGEFFVHMQTPQNRLNFSDCSRRASNTMIPAFFARFYGKVYWAKIMVNENNNFRSAAYDMLGNLNLSRAIDIWGDEDISNPPTDRYYYAAESGVFRNSFNTAKPTFIGFHAGTTDRAHDMLDSGEFVFEAGGVPWAIDLGGDNYNLPSYFGDDGYKIYRKHTQGENCILINPSVDPDNYFGQALGKEATLQKFVSKPKGAFAVVDLGAVYERDVNSYKRGYYFGDNRNTLTVQDEINLKSISELYWFMHTEAEIEIVDSNTARLFCDGEELLLKVYSNKAFTLSEMDAKPLSGTPVIAGQNENEGVSKVALHFENTSGDVNISVKLIHKNKCFTTDEHTFIPMDLWSVDDGIYEVDAVLYDVYSDFNKMFSASVQVPYSAKEVYLQINGEDFKKIDVSRGSAQSLKNIDVSSLSPGWYEARMRLVYENREEYTEGQLFSIKNYEKNVFYSNNMANNPVATAMPKDWYFSFVGCNTQYEEYVRVKKDSASYAALEFRTNNTSKAIKEEVIIMECDINLSSYDINFNIECKNENGIWFFNPYTLFYSGVMYDGVTYNVNQWYRIKLEINTVNNLCSFYVDDRIVMENLYIESATGNHVYKLQFTSSMEDAAVSFKNFEVYTMVADTENISMTISENNGGLNVKVEISDTMKVTASQFCFVVAEYSESKLIDIAFTGFKVPHEKEYFSLEHNFIPSDETVAYKAFLFEKSDVFIPVLPSVHYKIK